MPLTHERIEAKILAKIKIYDLTRAELLFTLCHEIPCNGHYFWYNAPLCSAVDFKCNSHHAFEISSATQRSCITVHNDSTFSHLSIKLNGFKLLKQFVR